MTKLCPRGKAAAKRKFKVYPSAYANAYASRICAGKIKDPSGVKRKDFRGPKKAEGGRIGLKEGFLPEDSPRKKALKKLGEKMKRDSEIFKKDPFSKFRRGVPSKKLKDIRPVQPSPQPDSPRKKAAGGGLMEATARLKKQGLKGGGMSSRGLGRAFMKGGRV
jgi:hypothetical protein